MSLARTFPIALEMFRSVRSMLNFCKCSERMIIFFKDMVKDMQVAAVDDHGRYEFSIATSLEWLARASSNAIVEPSEYLSYMGSCSNRICNLSC